jgi:hypothetical protein
LIASEKNGTWAAFVEMQETRQSDVARRRAFRDFANEKYSWTKTGKMTRTVDRGLAVKAAIAIWDSLRPYLAVFCTFL